MSRLLLYRSTRRKNEKICYVCKRECYTTVKYHPLHAECVDKKHVYRSVFRLFWMKEIDVLYRLGINIWCKKYVFKTLLYICNNDITAKNSLKKLAKLRYEDLYRVEVALTRISDDNAKLFLRRTAKRNRKLINKFYIKWAGRLRIGLNHPLATSKYIKSITKMIRKLEKFIRYSRKLNS